MPDALEFPRMLRPVVPLMCAGDTIVNKFVAFAFWKTVLALQLFRLAAGRVPGFPAVIRPLNDLPEPIARLRRVDPVRIHRRPFHVVNLPPGKIRPFHFPILTLRIRRQDERAFPCSRQYSYSTHLLELLTADYTDAHGFSLNNQ